MRDLRRRHPDAQVRTRHLDWNEATALPERRVDALVARMPFPFPTDRLRVTVLYDEPRALVVPTFHRLAGKESVTLDDFADEALVPCTGTATAWTEFWRLEPRPDGRPAQPAPVIVESFEDKLELVADDQAIAILPVGDRRITLRQDLATVPIEGSTRARSWSPPAPTNTTSWSPTSANPPEPTSPGAPWRAGARSPTPAGTGAAARPPPEAVERRAAFLLAHAPVTPSSTAASTWP